MRMARMRVRAQSMQDAFIEACAAGRTHVVSRLKEGVACPWTHLSQDTLRRGLVRACLCNHPDIVSVIMAVCVHQRYYLPQASLDDALDDACVAGHVDVVHILLRAARPARVRANDYRALKHACVFGRTAVVQCLFREMMQCTKGDLLPASPRPVHGWNRVVDSRDTLAASTWNHTAQTCVVASARCGQLATMRALVATLYPPPTVVPAVTWTLAMSAAIRSARTVVVEHLLNTRVLDAHVLPIDVEQLFLDACAFGGVSIMSAFMDCTLTPVIARTEVLQRGLILACHGRDDRGVRMLLITPLLAGTLCADVWAHAMAWGCGHDASITAALLSWRQSKSILAAHTKRHVMTTMCTEAAQNGVDGAASTRLLLNYIPDGLGMWTRPLYLACSGGHTDVVRAMVHISRAPCLDIYAAAHSALLGALHNGHIPTAEALAEGVRTLYANDCIQWDAVLESVEEVRLGPGWRVFLAMPGRTWRPQLHPALKFLLSRPPCQLPSRETMLACRVYEHYMWLRRRCMLVHRKKTRICRRRVRDNKRAKTQ